MTRGNGLLVAGLVLVHLFLRVGMGVTAGAPDLFLVAVVASARYGGTRGAAALGLLIGLVEDAFSVASFGASAFGLTVTAVLAGQFRHVSFGNRMVFLALCIVVGKWLRDLLAWTVSEDAARGGFVEQMLQISPLAALYTGVVGAVVTGVVRGLLGQERNR